MKLSRTLKFTPLFALLLISACSSEYSADDLKLSNQGAFVDRESGDELNGTLIVEKKTGELLRVEFEDGLPNGRVELSDNKGNAVLDANLVPKGKESSGFRAGFELINQLLLGSGGVISTKDYLDLFTEAAHYHGDYFAISERDGSRTTGEYDFGNKIGDWRVECSNGEVAEEIAFKKVDDTIIKVGKERRQACSGELIFSANRDQQGQLQGEFIENRLRSGAISKVAVRNYSDGKLDGVSEEYDYNGDLKSRTAYQAGVKHGEEQLYRGSGGLFSSSKSKTPFLFSSTEHELGLKHGEFKQYDAQKRVTQSGRYVKDKPVDIWTLTNYNRGTRSYTDYDAERFIVNKSSAFSEACAITTRSNGRVDWRKKAAASLADCAYFVENQVVDINKKLALDLRTPFESSANWTHAVILTPPPMFQKMRRHGANVSVADSQGRTRLHWCLYQIDQENSWNKEERCSLEHASEVIPLVDLDSVSNDGTAMHLIARQRVKKKTRRNQYLADRQLEIAKLITQQGANLDTLNHVGQTALMFALRSRDYELANVLLDAGVDPTRQDQESRSTLMYFFFNQRNQWRKDKIPAEGVEVLAKMAANGVDLDEPVFEGKPLLHYIESNNSLHHIQSIDAAKQRAVSVTPITRKFTSTQPSNNEDESPSNTDLVASSASTSNSDNDEPTPNSGIFKRALDTTSETADNLNAQSELPSPPNTEQTTLSPTPISNDTITAQSTDQSTGQSTEAATANAEIAKLLNDQVTFLVSQTEDHITHYRLKTPANNNAISSIAQIKKLDPNNTQIELLETRVGRRYLSLAESKAKKGDKAGAERNLQSAAEFLNDTDELDQAKVKIDSQVAKARQQKTQQQPVTNKTVATNNAGSANTAQNNTAGPVCDPTVKVTGIPFIGEKLVARQSFSHSPEFLLSKANAMIQSQNFTNVKQRGNSVKFEQVLTSSKIRFNFSVSDDGNNTVELEARVPTGAFLTKKNFRISFCDYVATL